MAGNSTTEEENETKESSQEEKNKGLRQQILSIFEPNSRIFFAYLII